MDNRDTDLAKFRGILEANENIRDAYDVRQRYMRALREELVSRDLLPAKVLDDDRYFHHQVLAYMAAKRFVDRLVDNSHPAASEFLQQFVITKAASLPGRQRTGGQRTASR